MDRKIMVAVLAGALMVGLFGCKRQEPTARKTEVETEREAAGRTPEAVGGAAEVTMAQKQQYVQGAQQIINSLEQKMQTWQEQAGAAAQEQQTQQLQQRFQQELADARTALEKLRNATGEQVTEAKVAVDQAIEDAQKAFQNLQASTTGAAQVTQAQ